ncbi:MAG TPA: glycosyltransferase family 2 protein [Puia sp.]
MNESSGNLPLVTVAMVTYNSGAYVRMAIESVLSSSYRNFELIIADDNSSDNTWEIISSFRDSRIQAIRNEKNIGEYVNRNQCVQKAKGEYLIFIDGDDIIYPHGMAYMVKMLEAFPECGMTLMYPYDPRVILPVTFSPRDFYLNYYCGTGLMDVAFTNTLFRLETLRKAGGISARYKSGDNHARLMVAALADTLIIGDQLTWWRISPGQASQQLNSNVRLAMWEAIDICNTALNSPQCPLTEEEKKKTRNNIGFRLKMEILQRCKRLDLGQAFRLLPLAKEIPVSLGQLLSTSMDRSLDPLKDYNGTNPYKLDFSRNPFSSF